jgi:hypothetical protein
MGKHARNPDDRRYLRLVTAGEPDLAVRRSGVADLELVETAVASRPADPAEGAGEMGAAPEAAEPEEYGVRVSWQSEAVRIEAAEFLIATRLQEDARRRAPHVLAAMRRARRR